MEEKILPKDPTKYYEALEQFYQFLRENGMEAVPNQETLFNILVGGFEKSVKDTRLVYFKNFGFDSFGAIASTARRLEKAYREGYVEKPVRGTAGAWYDCPVNQSSRSFYDRERRMFGFVISNEVHYPFGLSERTLHEGDDLKKGDKRITALFEYSVGTLHEKGETFEFKKGKGRELADRLRIYYQIEYDGGSPL